ncbi:MAG: flagellar brake protein [Candidatus Firestonebacteria bacterium]|nr:flagellar brake protein [Candidatus Firestonebacteria bacterium]
MMPEINVNLQLIIEPDSSEYPGRYLSRIEDFNNNYLFISAPMSQQLFVPIRIGTSLKISFFDGPKSYTFQTSVIDRISEPFPMLIIARPVHYEQKERRRFPRYKAVVPVYVKVNSTEAAKFLGLTDGFDTISMNISVGGIYIESHLPIPTGTILQLGISLPSIKEPILVLSKVIRTIDQSNGKYGIAIKFLIIDEKKRDEILKFIFDLERGTIKNQGMKI